MRLSTHRALLSPPHGGAGRRVVWRREDGQTLIEFAFVLPVLLFILVGILKCGLLFNNYITLNNAVRSGARTLALGRGLQGDPCDVAFSDAEGKGAPTLSLTRGSFTTGFSGGETCMTTSNWLQGDQATLTGTYPCDLTILGINLWPGCSLTASATEAIE